MLHRNNTEAKGSFFAVVTRIFTQISLQIRTMAVSARPETRFVLVEIPAPHVLLVTVNLENRMNALPVEACWELDRLWKWFDDEPELYVIPRSLCNICS